MNFHPIHWAIFYLVAVGASIWLVARTNGGTKKAVVLLACVVAAWQLAWLDDKLGAREFQRICVERAGIRVFRRVELPPEEFTNEGLPIWLNLTNQLYSTIRDGRFALRHESTPVAGPHFTRVERYSLLVVETSTGNVLASDTTFFGTYGGPPRPVEVGRRNCREPSNEHARDLFRAVFAPRHPERTTPNNAFKSDAPVAGAPGVPSGYALGAA